MLSATPPPSESSSSQSLQCNQPTSAALTSSSRASSRTGSDSANPNSEEASRAETRKAKKAAYNARRKRYKHYHENASVYKIVRKTGHLLQVAFSTSLPFPSDDARDMEVNSAFKDALDSLGYDEDFYTLSVEDMKLVCGWRYLRYLGDYLR